MRHNTSPLLIITGLAGAGMSSALKDLEDLGYEVFDNFPPGLVEPLLENANTQPIAIGIDARTRGFSADSVLDLTRRLRAQLVYLTADDAVLQRRFTETRRRHPLAKDRPVAAGIKAEQELTHALRRAAHLVVDTTALSVHDLKRILRENFALDAAPQLSIALMSFGFRFGLPREADIVMDLRYLKNPHWVPELKPLSGLDAPVGAYIAADENFATFQINLQNLLAPLLPLYAREGKSYLTIALGCTGGRHRSVYAVEAFKEWLSRQGYATAVQHRDIDR